MADHSEEIARFINVTGATPEQAQQYLNMTNYSVPDAVGAFYQAADQSEPSEGDAEDDALDNDAPEPVRGPAISAAAPSGGRRLGEAGDPVASAAPPSAASASQRVQPSSQQKKRLMSLRDLQADGSAGQGRGPAGDGGDDSDKEQEFYAGGDKSGLAVQDPSASGHRDQIQRLMQTARRGGGQRPPPNESDEEAALRRTHFSGSGQTLGGDDAESRVVPAAQSARTQRPTEMVERILHLWEDGFSIDDGDLYRYDDPANRAILDMINAGSAPMDLMNVQDGQAVDVKLDDHRGQKFVQPKKKYKPFGGSGNRLGSPVPGPQLQTSTPQASRAPPASAPTPVAMEVDESQPTLNLQIRLADGTRLPSRFNTTNTIGDVYGFIERARGGEQRSYVLATTFPTRDLTDMTQVLGEMTEFKRGGVVVQKWT